ncbi:MAG: amino acid ABC transporter substrate-binding protein [Elusimicrobia bacterium]|nr:amino acid ABC transporter substrate-binding protein [Elusimicrobiota bacterium]
MTRVTRAVLVAGLVAVMGRPASADNEIILGASLPTTGKYAVDGNLTLNGYKIGVDRVNARGGVKVGDKTYKLKLVHTDNQSLPEKVAEDTERQITKEGIKFLLGSYSSALIQVQGPIIEKHKTPFVEAEGADRSLFNQGNKYFFGVLNTADAYVLPAIDLLAEKAKATGQDVMTLKVAIAVEPDPFSRDIRAGALEAAKKHGMSVVVDGELPKDLSDMTPILEKVKLAKPTILVVSGHAKGASLLAKQLTSMKVEVPMVAVTHCDSAKLIENFGKAVEGFLCPSQWDDSLPLKDRWFDTAAAYGKSYKEEFKQEAAYQAAQASAAILVYANAFEKAGSLDKEKVRDALAATNLRTFYGVIRFDEAGKNMAKTMVLYQIQKGDFKVVAPSQWAQSEFMYPVTRQ